MALRDLFKADFGVTERNFNPYQGFGDIKRALFGNTANAQTFGVGEGLNREQAQKAGQVLGTQTGRTSPLPVAPDKAVSNPAGITPTTGGGAQPSGGNFLSGGNFGDNVDTSAYDAEKARIQAETQAREQQAAQAGRDAYGNIISNYSTQLSRLPNELGELQGGIQRGAEAGRNLIQGQLQAALSTLGRQEDTTRAETQKNLRSLAEDQRNTTTSLARQLGAKGAGDTSAGDYASAAIGRQGLKQRGTALETQQQAISAINEQRQQAQIIADQEVNKLEQAKQAQLTSLAADFQGIMRQLEEAKANASRDEALYIQGQQNQLRDDLSNRLNELSDEVRQRKAALSDWYAQQEAQLNFGLKRLAGQGTYSGLPGDLANISKAGSLIARLGGNLSPSGQQYIAEQFGVPAGYLEFGAQEEDPLKRLETISAYQDAGYEPPSGLTEGLTPLGDTQGGLFSNGIDDIPFFPG